MSLHTQDRACESDGWITRCACGWVGDHSPTHSVAERQYREHVEEALGADAYYSAPVACRNCGSEHEQGVLVGTHVTVNPCVRCGTVMLNPSNDAWDESKPFRGLFG